MASDLIASIKAELQRIGADRGTVGPTDEIRVKDRREGYAELVGSPRAADFSWFGKADEILERVSGLPAGGGPEVIRSEFHT